MSKTKVRYRTELDTSDTREARLQAAQMFVEGDRVRHNITGKLGKFIEVNLGFALPEVWIEFDSETEIHIPLSCNPLLVEVIDKTCTRQRVAGKPVLLENKDLCKSEPQVFLTPGELPIESNEQSTDDTQEERVAVVSEVLEELSTGSSNYKLKTEPNEKIIQEVIAIAVIDDTQVVAAEVVEELSEQEEAERHRLELKVERAFVEAGWALQELRDRRLYRNTHKSFEDYCRDRFGMNRSRSYQLIDAATVFDNLTECPQIVDILPTNESQCRPLIQLEPDEQREAWQQAVKAVDGKVPSGRIVKSIVQRLKERGITLPPISFQEGDVVLIRGAGNLDLRKYDGQWAIALRINEYTVAIALDGKEIVVKPQFLEEVGPEYWTEIKAVNERITRLQLEYNLDAAEDAVLEVLRRRTSFTQKQMTLLAFLEQQYGIC